VLEIGPNLQVVLLGLVAILSLLAQGYLAGQHAEKVQKNGSELVKPVLVPPQKASEPAENKGT
jgi:hypothetical protein